MQSLLTNKEKNYHTQIFIYSVNSVKEINFPLTDREIEYRYSIYIYPQSFFDKHTFSKKRSSISREMFFSTRQTK